MKSNLRFGILLMGIVIVLMALMQAGRKEPLNWSKTFNPSHTRPYGTYVLKHELPTFFQKKPKVKEIKQTLYTYFTSNETSANDAFIYVGASFYPGDASNRQLLNFVHDGGTAFIAANHIESSLLDTLGVNYDSYSPYQAKQGISEESVYIQLLKTQEGAIYDRISSQKDQPFIFNSFRKKDSVQILGNVKISRLQMPNFIQIQFGKGIVYLHLTPEVFTNYYFLQKETYPIAFHSLQYLDGKNILWYDGLYNIDQSETPMRFILSQKSLTMAWYILLFALLILLIFRSRREQRAIPIIVPEENKSIEFAKTIGSLYFENGKPQDMVAKKIHYFLYDIRRYYRLDTNDLTNQKFIHSLSQRTHIDENEWIDLMNELNRLRVKNDCTTDDLKRVYHLIEDFKQKAKMI